MKTSAVFAFACLLRAAAAVTSSESTTPVEKVVNLLTDLKGKIAQDGKEEAQVYDKYACWCEKTSSRKAGAIETAQDELRSLGQLILKLKGEVAVLEAEMAKLQEDMDENKEAQATATAIRQRENAAYTAETTEMKEALAALQKAIAVLSEGTGFLQQGITVGTSTRGVDAVRSLVETLPVKTALKQSQVSMLSEFVAGKGKDTYAPQSLTVQGILRDMYETFSSDLESSTLTEASRQRGFEDLIAIKTDELAQLQASFDSKESQKADAEALLATTTQSYDDTESQMHADITFFDETKAACESKSSEWNTRKALRAEELEGIKKALELLSSDSARELFKGAIKAGKETGMVDSYDTGVDITSFLQVRRGSGASQLATRGEATNALNAYKTLKAKATALHSLRLGMLAVQVREAKVGHFDKVLAAIDTMIATLKEEDAADIAKRDQCIEEYKNIDSNVANITWLIEKNVAKIDKLESLIQARTAEKVQTIADISNVKEQIATMTSERENTNMVFKNTKAEDQAAIELLMQARTVLSAYYKNNSIALGPIQGEVKGLALASSQQGPVFEVSEDDAPDAIFSGKGKRKNDAKGIVQLLTMIIEDLNDEIKNGMRDEEATQLEYEKLLKAAQTLQKQLEAKKINLEEAIANFGEEKSDESELKLENQGDLKNEMDYKAAIKVDCDWILKAFTERAEKRQAELAGLSGAKEFLAGYDKTAFIDTRLKH